jgi:hypothetical protein
MLQVVAGTTLTPARARPRQRGTQGATMRTARDRGFLDATPARELIVNPTDPTADARITLETVVVRIRRPELDQDIIRDDLMRLRVSRRASRIRRKLNSSLRSKTATTSRTSWSRQASATART